VLAAWFPGTEAGNAIADLLCGRRNPSGRLPVSWPVEAGQIPVFYAERPTGRPRDPANRYTSKYIDLPNAPLFPFGHGLSYTRFAYGGLRATPAALRPGGRVLVEVEVANEGAVAGEETVLLFVRDRVATLARPVLELKGCAKVALAPGARRTVSLTLAADDLAFPGPDLTPRPEPGDFDLLVGPCADLGRLLATGIRLLPD
jgi:beta-glucosidase